MVERYRTVYFTEDPYVGRSVAIAIRIQAGGAVTCVPLSPLPTKLFGSQEAHAVASLIIEEVARSEDFDKLPDSCGPHASQSPASDSRAHLTDTLMIMFAQLRNREPTYGQLAYEAGVAFLLANHPAEDLPDGGYAVWQELSEQDRAYWESLAGVVSRVAVAWSKGKRR